MSNNKVKKAVVSNGDVESVRINKYLSDAGVCSRREADRLIEAGKVKIEDTIATTGDRVFKGQTVSVNGKKVKKEEESILIAFNKPRGIVCTSEKREPNNIIDYLDFGKRIYPIGRLDKDSEGLILLTNNGEIVNKILRGSNYHEKEYIVKVNKPISRAFLKGMTSGVPILDTVTRPCEITTLDKYTFKIILTQGLNRQIRRMCEYFGYRVLELKRIRIMNIKLGYLNVGGYRNVTEYEYEELIKLIDDSSNDPTYIDDEMDGIIHDEASKKNGNRSSDYYQKGGKQGNRHQKTVEKGKGQGFKKDKSKSTEKVGYTTKKDTLKETKLQSGAGDKKNPNGKKDSTSSKRPQNEDQELAYSKRTQRMISKKNKASQKDAYKEIFNGRQANTYQRKGR